MSNIKFPPQLPALIHVQINRHTCNFCCNSLLVRDGIVWRTSRRFPHPSLSGPPPSPYCLRHPPPPTPAPLSYVQPPTVSISRSFHMYVWVRVWVCVCVCARVHTRMRACMWVRERSELPGNSFESIRAVLNLTMIISASNAKIGLVETSLAIIPGGGKLLSAVWQI